MIPSFRRRALAAYWRNVLKDASRDLQKEDQRPIASCYECRQAAYERSPGVWFSRGDLGAMCADCYIKAAIRARMMYPTEEDARLLKGAGFIQKDSVPQSTPSESWWAIQMMGPAYLAVRDTKVGFVSLAEFYWELDKDKAIHFRTQDQATMVMKAVSEICKNLFPKCLPKEPEVVEFALTFPPSLFPKLHAKAAEAKQ